MIKDGEPPEVVGYRASPPVVPRGFVPRPRVGSLLDHAAAGPVTLLSAGPGYGKTLAVAEWARRVDVRVAWLSVDLSDDRLPGFWSSLVGSVRVSGVVAADNPLADLSPAANFRVEDAVLVADALGRLPTPVVIVLDDLHVLRDREVLLSVELFLDRLPRNVHVIMSSRFDPPLRWRRLAVSDRLTEIRAEQLAFDDAEAAQLLATGGVTLTPTAVSHLLERTRGWAAGLRLAASGLDPEKPEESVARLRGSDRPVAEYLMQEVLDQLAAQDRRFLLLASVVDPVSADVVNRLTGVVDGQGRLERLEDGNGFLLGLGAGRRWFTWHPLFREMLLHRLTVEFPDLIGDLHRRAAGWFLEHGDNLAAMRHLNEAGDLLAVGRILTERIAPDVVTAAAPELVQALAPVAAAAEYDPTPTTLLASAVCNFHRFDYEAMLRDVTAAEAAVGPETTERAPGGVEVLIGSLQMGYARACQPTELTQRSARVLKVLDGLSRRELPAVERYRAIATTNLGTGLLWDGALRSAAEALATGETTCHRWGLGLSELTARSHRALLAALCGRVPQARDRAERARSIAEQHGWTREPQASGHLIALAIVARDTGRAHDAEQLITAGTRDARPDMACRMGFAVLALEASLAGNDAVRQDRCAQAVSDLLGRSGQLPALLAGWGMVVLAEHLAARQRVHEARTLLHRVPDTGYTNARRTVTLARCLMLADDPAASLQVLTTSMSACAPYTAVAVDAGILAAAAAQELRRDAQALKLLSTAIDLAAEPNIIAPFLTATHSIEPLLERHRMLVARHRDFTAAVRTAAPHAVSVPVSGSDAHALTDRERAILPYLATHLKAIEIAAELYLSVNTIKTHQQSMYRKLGVANRREAVDRGRELGLI